MLLSLLSGALRYSHSLLLLWTWPSRVLPSLHLTGGRPGLASVSPTMSTGCDSKLWQPLPRCWTPASQPVSQQGPRTCSSRLLLSMVVRAAQLPNPTGATLGTLPKDQWDRVAKEAARTIPGREHGGNCDIKNLTRGCKV